MPKPAEKQLTKRKATELIFESYGLPGWLGWGTAGAESTYGTNGSYAFGGIDLPNSGNGNYLVEARESAKAYKGLVEQYGSVAAAVPHYSGNSYTISHVRSLASGGGSTTLAAWGPQDLLPGGVGLSLLEELGIHIPNPGGPLVEGQKKALEALGSGNPLESITGGISGTLTGITSLFEFFKVAGELLFTPEGWIRIGKLVGGAIFFVWGLERLVVGSSPSSGPVSSLAKDAAIAAVVK